VLDNSLIKESPRLSPLLKDHRSNLLISSYTGACVLISVKYYPRPKAQNDNTSSYLCNAIIKEVESIKMKFLSMAKNEVVCALVNCGCRGRTEFRREFEAFLYDCHHRWAIRKSWNNWNSRIA
jgi:hypothetical protein